ncbi:hypothetical protein V6N13_025240 [Hibiscus sabdariffa]
MRWLRPQYVHYIKTICKGWAIGQFLVAQVGSCIKIKGLVEWRFKELGGPGIEGTNKVDEGHPRSRSCNNSQRVRLTQTRGAELMYLSGTYFFLLIMRDLGIFGVFKISTLINALDIYLM